MRLYTNESKRVGHRFMIEYGNEFKIKEFVLLEYHLEG